VAWFRQNAIRRRHDGRYEVRLDQDVRRMLASVAEQMGELISEEPDDPALERLAPPAYPDDPFRDAEYQVLSGDKLRDGRASSYRMLASTAERSVLTEDELSTWMRAVNDVRLVLGTRLDVSEEDPPLNLIGADFDDPEVQARWLYETLGQIQYEIVTALSKAL
jgi:hypothetical protein